MKLQPGTLLQGDRYRIIDVLGQGGFGITYLAEQVMAERKVCIKEFFPKEYYNRNEDSRSISLGSQGSAEIMELYKAKFIKEAKTIAKLDHPNIIHIFDVFAENNTAYYVMEYIDGESLSALVKSRGVLPESEAIGYIKQVAAALGSIHEQRIMHLDIKPANVMLRKEDGRAVLIDFGLSKQYDAEGNQTSSTPVGISAGYAPMEQYKQGGVREFSPETDIYSLGATLYYLVTGNVPPQAADIADDGLPTLPSHLSPGVRNAIERSMEVQRKRRPHSIKEFLALLEDNTPKVVATPTPKPVSEETAFGAPASNAADDRTVVSTPTPKAEAPKKEWTPKYSTEKPKKSDEPKKKSKWWMWLLIVAVVAIGGYLALSGSNDSETAKSEQVQNRQAEEAEKARIAEEKRQAEEAEKARIAEEKRQAEESEKARKAEEKRQAEEAEKARVAEEKRKTEEVKPVAPKQKIQPNNEIWYTSSDGKVVKPYEEGKGIFGAEIESNTYEGGKGIIKFKGNVTTIGDGAFYECYNLSSITIPNSVTTIGGDVFYKCESLKSVTIPNSVTTIGEYAFLCCESLTSVTIPNSVTTIEYGAFESCESLTSVTIPNSVTTIGDYAFMCCNNLKEFRGEFASPDGRCLIVNGKLIAFAPAGITEYTIPNSVTTIRKRAFFSCDNLTSVTIPNSVTTIEYGAFGCCRNLKEFKGGFAFSNGRCLIINGKLVAFAPAGITKFTIPNSVTTIGDSAFYECHNLSSVTIPNSVTTIGKWAFYECKSLTSITIPNSVTMIGDYAFAYRNNLSEETKKKIKSINPIAL